MLIAALPPRETDGLTLHQLKASELISCYYRYFNCLKKLEFVLFLKTCTNSAQEQLKKIPICFPKIKITRLGLQLSYRNADRSGLGRNILQTPLSFCTSQKQKIGYSALAMMEMGQRNNYRCNYKLQLMQIVQYSFLQTMHSQFFTILTCTVIEYFRHYSSSLF